MIINSIKIERSEMWVCIPVTHRKKKFELIVKVINGKVEGDYKKVMTSYLTYFNENSAWARHKHFEQIKEYIEPKI